MHTRRHAHAHRGTKAHLGSMCGARSIIGIFAKPKGWVSVRKPSSALRCGLSKAGRRGATRNVPKEVSIAHTRNAQNTKH